jgi:hypothetical protein
MRLIPTPDVERPVDGAVMVVTEFRLDATDPDHGPQCKLVRQPPQTTIRPHFHNVDQFQLVTAGGGRLGAHPVAPGLVHYSDRSTPYGPIVAGGNGLSYLTLRPPPAADEDSRARYMPEARRELEVRPGRNLTASTAAFLNATATATATLLREDDGVLASETTAAPGDPLPDPTSSAEDRGGYLVLLEGELTDSSGTHRPVSCFWLDPRDDWPALTAGATGARAVHLHFGRGLPRRTRD